MFPKLPGEYAVSLVPGYCTLCRSRCGALYEVHDGAVTKVLPSESHPTGGALCAKGRSAPEHLRSPLRLTRPLRRTTPRGSTDPGWVEISWDEALSEIAGKLDAARRTDGPESVAFAVTTPSGTPMVDSFEWVERFIRCYGSPNLVYAIEVCGWHKDYAHALTFGRGIGMPDMNHTDTILLWGHNPARTWLAQASRIASARRRGAQVVVVDPKQAGSGQEADLWMRIRPGTDAALALGAIRHLIATRTFDELFVSNWTNAAMLVNLDTGRLVRSNELWVGEPHESFVTCLGQDQFSPFDPSSARTRKPSLDVRGTLTDKSGKSVPFASVFHLLSRHVDAFTVENVAKHTWIPKTDIERFNALFENSPRLSYHAWTGVGQHSNATQTERAIAALYAMTGACDRKGGNLWTIAPPYRSVNHYETLLSPEQRRKALGLADLPLGPPRFGFITAHDFAKAVTTQDPYPVRTLMSFGSNLLVSQADTSRNRNALQALQFHVHVDMYMNPTAENADIVLPANMPWEREALRCGFEITQSAAEHIQLRQRVVEPLGETRSDYEIVFDLARRLGMDEEFFDGNIEAGWNHQLEPLGITVADLRKHPEGLDFPQEFEFQKYSKVGKNGGIQGFGTPSRLIELYSEQLLDIQQPALPSFVYPESLRAADGTNTEFPLTLSSAKNGWYIHSSHRHVASLRRKAPYPIVEISPALATLHGISEGDRVYVVTAYGRVALQAAIRPALHDQVILADFGWWQGCEPLGLDGNEITGQRTRNLNSVLSDTHRDPVSGSVPLRAVACRIEPDLKHNRQRWAGQRAFTVSKKEVLSEGVVRLELESESGKAVPEFLPGQHIYVSEEYGNLERPYSLISSHLSSSRVSIAVGLERGRDGIIGRMSGHLHTIPIGSRLLISMPRGAFTIPRKTARPIVLAANGIGITPFIGYLESLLETPAEDRPSRILLIYVCRDGATHAFRERLRDFQRLLPELRAIIVYRRPRPIDQLNIHYDAMGMVDYGWIDDLLVSERALVYLCGSDRFTSDARKQVGERGIPHFDVFSEVFAKTIAPPKNLSAQNISVEGEEKSFEWLPEHGSILDCAERNHIPMPSGCHVGQCESCLVQLVSGKVTHLGQYDGPPDHCLTCQAIPLTPITLRR